jgi:hypothetical protein
VATPASAQDGNKFFRLGVQSIAYILQVMSASLLVGTV